MNLPFSKNEYRTQEAQILTESSSTTQPRRDSGFWANAKAKGMGLLLVLFPEETSPIADKPKFFPSPSSSPPTSSSVKKTNSIRVFYTAQCIISICALLLFTTLVLFALSTIEPTAHRRFLSQKYPTIHNPTIQPEASARFFKWEGTQLAKCASKREHFPSPALQRMGTLYRRGTRAMKDLIVGHVVADTTDEEFRLFLRVLHRSGLTGSADVVFIFDSASLPSRFTPIIQEENESFFSLIQHYIQMNATHHSHKNRKQSANFDVTKFLKMVKKGTELEEPLWGPRTRSNITNPETGNAGSEQIVPILSYGSVLRFDPEELDPENSLFGFLDHVPLSLRRWACYPMLLGRVKRSFKHVMLVDVKNMVVVKDPLGRVRNRSPESILLHRDPDRSFSTPQGGKNSEKTQGAGRVNSAIIVGGGKGIRRLSKAMLTEIVRWAMKKRGKSSVSESVVLSHLVGNRVTLKNVNLITANESISDTSSLADPSSASATSLWDYVIIQRPSEDHDPGLNSFIKKHLCSSELDSSLYRDC